MTLTAARPTTSTDTACTRDARITRSLLGYGVLAGPLYVGVSLAQAFTRDGFDVTRHAWSLLADGHHGWIQVVNFLVSGAFVVAAAVGLHRAMGGWAPRLVGGYGLGLVLAGCLRADPAQGFPAGTPDGPGTISWHGAGHLTAGGLGFLCVIAACLVAGRYFACAGRRGWAWYSRISGIVFLVAFAGIASGGTLPALTLGFAAGVVVIFAWLAAVSVHCYRTA